MSLGFRFESVMGLGDMGLRMIYVSRRKRK